jgi:endonuclease/exonuclease/phosphatase family metal-dependent hydrolase
MSLQGVWAHDATETPAQIEMGNRISKYVQGKNNVILAGDFNVNEGTQTIDLLGESLSNIFKGERRTSFNMTRKGPQFSEAVVDFVFTSPNIKVADHHTATADVSDHQSQIVVLEL